MKSAFLRVALAAACFLAPVAASGSEVLYFGGDVFTGEGNRPSATWFVVRDGLVVAVGDGAGV
ncbi:MAG TPA: hypothetical protein VGE01_08220, partial [Fimbriimonas sp.]